MITKLGKVAVGSFFTLIRHGVRYKILSNKIVKNQIQILCKEADSERVVKLHSTCNVWVKPKPRIKLKGKHAIQSSN